MRQPVRERRHAEQFARPAEDDGIELRAHLGGGVAVFLPMVRTSRPRTRGATALLCVATGGPKNLKRNCIVGKTCKQLSI